MVCLGNHYLTIVDVVPTQVRIVGILNNKRPTQAIAILAIEMAMIPKCPLRFSQNKLIVSLMCNERKVPLGPMP